MIDSAPENARASGFDQSTSDPLRPPTERYAPVLGPDAHALLSACSSEAAKHMTQLDDRSLAYLTEATAKPWSKENFDPGLAATQGGLLRARNAALREGLEAARLFGEHGQDFDGMIREQKWRDLREIEGQLSVLPEIGNPDKLLGANLVPAIVQDACQQVLVERSRDRAGPSRGAARDQGSEPDIGF
jgi:hypothetical protein